MFRNQIKMRTIKEKFHVEEDSYYIIYVDSIYAE